MEDDPENEPYKVGFGKPPVEHQFKKGRSGNPNGRPRRSAVAPKPLSIDPMRDIVLQELNRPVRVREGGVMIELTAFQAALRQLMTRAMLGDHRSHRLVTEIQKRAAQEQREDRRDQIETVERYKAEWGPKFDQARREGLPEPDQLPHPDHVNISRETGVLELTGPDTPELKWAWDFLKRSLWDLQFRVAEAQRKSDNAPEDADLRRELNEAQKKLRKLEKQVPPGWNWRERLGDVDF